jgi:hypothetical protein
MNNSTLLTADRATHIRIVVVALAFATLIVGIGLAAHLNLAPAPSEPTITKAPSALVALTGSRTFR